MPQPFRADPPPPVPADLLLSAIVDSSDDAILSKDLNGIITSWNEAATRIFGYTREEAVGQSVTMLLPPDRQGEEIEILARVRKGEKVDHFETVRQRKNGELIDVSVTISPIRTADGRIIGASKVARDISDQKRAGRDGLLLAAIVSSSDDAIVSKNLDGIITSWNQGAQRIFGYTPEEAIGNPVLMLVPEDRHDEEPKILASLRKGDRVDHFETIRRRKNGELFAVSLTISPVRDSSGKVIGASKIARDISDLHRIRLDRERIAKELEQLLASERAARHQAESANRMKDDFLSTVSHELRTPLNAIVGWTQVLRESEGISPATTEGLDVIERNARAQAQLIDDLLDMGRITSGKMTLDVEWVDIRSIISDSIASMRQAAELKRITLRALMNEMRDGMKGDKRRLQQVLLNLLTNSIKFTPAGGKVVVSLSRVNSHIEIAVSDNGRGINAEFLPFVFERFRQADSTITRQYGGLGIGLALSKQLVEMHGGEIRASSPGEGKGATFTILLPVIVSHHGEPAQQTTQTPPDLMDAALKADLDGIRVLALDDDKDSLDVIRRILTARRAVVVTASSAEDALQAFSEASPDVILSDIGMPTVDGYEFIRRLRLLPGGAKTPAAALTALARSEDRMRALNAGFQTHVAKPVDPAELIAIVRSMAVLAVR